MIVRWPPAAGEPVATAVLRSRPEDFQVDEVLGFEPGGEGEHVFLHLRKRELNTLDLVHRVSRLSGIGQRDIGLSGLKDRNAVTSQWLSVRMAGRGEPDWGALEADGDVEVLAVQRHQRKLKRGVHRANCFRLVLRELRGKREEIEGRLRQLRQRGAPNYFGEQRFGRGGSTLAQAREWLAGGGRRISRNRRSLYLSALRSYLFNELLAARVLDDSWEQPQPGDVCILAGTRSQFRCDEVDEDILRRAAEGDIHPALPLWGRGSSAAGPEVAAWVLQQLAGEAETTTFLEAAGMKMDWRASRILPDDFCWQFCDDDTLQLEFVLGAGSYATALLAEFVQYNQNMGSGKGSEQG